MTDEQKLTQLQSVEAAALPEHDRNRVYVRRWYLKRKLERPGEYRKHVRNTVALAAIRRRATLARQLSRMANGFRLSGNSQLAGLCREVARQFVELNHGR